MKSCFNSVINRGDVSIAEALSDKDITFINPLMNSGKTINKKRSEEFKTEFYHLEVFASNTVKHFSTDSNK